MCICKRVLSFAYLLYKPDKGLFIIYGGGGRDFEGTHFFGKSQMGATYFWHVADGDTFFGTFFFKTPAKTHFLRVSGKNKTIKYFRQKMFLRGHFILAGRLGGTFLAVGKPKSPPPAINNKQSLTKPVSKNQMCIP